MTYWKKTLETFKTDKGIIVRKLKKKKNFKVGKRQKTQDKYSYRIGTNNSLRGNLKYK